MDKMIIQLSGAAVCLILLSMISAVGALAVMVAGAVVLGAVGVQRYRLHIRGIEAGIRQAETAASFQAVSSPHGVLSLHNGVLQFWTKQSAEISHPVGIPDNFDFMQGAGHPQITAIDAAMNIGRALIVGSTRSGKTYFCKQLAHQWLQRGDMVFALDPKDIDPDDLWPEDVVVIGTGDDYDAMSDFWDWLDAEKADRGRDLRATKNKPFIHIFFDEINDALFDRPDFKEPYVRTLRKYAQYRIGIFCIGHSDNLIDIGLEGHGPLKSNFQINLYFEYNEFVGKRRVECDFKDGNGKQELAPYQPVNFITGTPYSQSKSNCQSQGVKPSNTANTGFDRPFDHFDRVDTLTIDHHPDQPAYVWEPPEPRRFYETKEHKAICEMHLKGASLNQISNAVWGYGNTRINQKIKAVLGKYGVL